MKKIIIAFDLGATNLRMTSFLNDKQLLCIREKTVANKERLISQLIRMIDTLKVGYVLEKICGAVCGIIDKKSRVIKSLPNINIENLDLVGELKRCYGVNVYIENDANCSALFEANAGLGKDKEIVLYLTISSGIGGGLVIDRKVYSGGFGGALEIGKNKLDEVIFEKECSGIALKNHLASINSDFKDYFKSDYLKDSFFINWMKKSSIHIANLIHTLDPDVIIFGGGVFNSKEYFFDLLTENIEKQLFNTFVGRISYVISPHYEDSPLLGSLYLR